MMVVAVLLTRDGGDGAVDLCPEVGGLRGEEATGCGPVGSGFDSRGTFGEQGGVGERRLLADLAGAVELVHGGGAEGP